MLASSTETAFRGSGCNTSETYFEPGPVWHERPAPWLRQLGKHYQVDSDFCATSGGEQSQEAGESLAARPQLFNGIITNHGCHTSQGSRVVTGCTILNAPCMRVNSDCNHADLELVTTCMKGGVIIVGPSGPILCPITSWS